MKKRILSEHYEYSLEKMKAFSNHASLGNHSDVKGLSREGFVKYFLKLNLPSLIEYYTGELIDENDERSGQLDIILQSALSPKINLFEDINIGFNDYSLGVIEVKSTLTTAAWGQNSHLENTFKSFDKIKRLKRNTILKFNINGEDKFIDKTPCFLVCFNGPTYETLIEKMIDYAKVHSDTEGFFIPDLVVCINREYSIYKNNGFLYNKQGNEPFGATIGKECLVPLHQFIYRMIHSWFMDKPIGEVNFGKYFE